MSVGHFSSFHVPRGRFRDPFDKTGRMDIVGIRPRAIAIESKGAT